MPADDELTRAYISHRNLRSFAEGFIEGAADRFDEDVVIEQTSCTKRGNPSCVIHLRFKKR